MSQPKQFAKHVSLPLEVHFYPHHGRYDTASILRSSGTPIFLGGVKHRRWWAAPEGGLPAVEEVDLHDACNEFCSVDPYDPGRNFDGDFEQFTYTNGKFDNTSFSELRVDRRSYDGTEGSAEIGLETDFQEWRALVRRAIDMPIAKWPTLAKRFPKRKVERLLRPPLIQLAWQNGKPIAKIIERTALGAIIASIYIDQLNGVQCRYCSKLGCGRRFRLKSNHVRIYCSQKCAHYMAVKKSRQRAPQDARRKR